MKSLHRRWRSVVARPSISYYHAFSGHLHTLDSFLSFLPGALVYGFFGFIVHFDSFAARFGLYALASLAVHSPPRCFGSALQSSFCSSFSIVFGLFLWTAMFRSERASSFSCYALLCLSLIWSGTTQAEKGRMEDNSYRHPAALQMSCTRTQMLLSATVLLPGVEVWFFVCMSLVFSVRIMYCTVSCPSLVPFGPKFSILHKGGERTFIFCSK